MKLEDKTGILLGIAFILCVLVLVADLLNIREPSWEYTYIATILGVVGYVLIAVAVNLRWPSNLTKVMSLVLLGAYPMVYMIEIEKFQEMFTEKFILASLICCISGMIIALTYLWATRDLFDVEVVEVQPIYE